MSVSTRKVVWSECTVKEIPGGFSVFLDHRPLKTPAQADFTLPTSQLAEAVADEWRAQTDKIDPLSMPLTRLSNSAIDKIPLQFEETVDALAGYAETDMTCFRAASPEELVKRQAAAWDPPLEWLRATHGIVLVQSEGVIAADQPPKSLSAMRNWLAELGPFTLMGLHDLIGISGSIVLARAVHEGHLDPQSAWSASILDEMWNVELWGEDTEAARVRDVKCREFLAAHAFLTQLENKQ